MPQFAVNPNRFDPYENFKFRVMWDGRYVAGVSRISALRRHRFHPRLIWSSRPRR